VAVGTSDHQRRLEPWRHVHLWVLQNRLERLGIEIENVPCEGWRIKPEHSERFLAAVVAIGA
jgi:hypothetical protein